MTKKQKENHIEILKNFIRTNGFVVDRWGNFIKKNENIVFRIKIMKNNLRFEWKKNRPKSIWFNIFSKPLVNINEDYLNGYLQERTK